MSPQNDSSRPFAQSGRDARESLDLARGVRREPFAMLAQNAAVIMPARWLDPDLAQHSLERELDDLLRFPRVGFLLEEHRQESLSRLEALKR